MDHLQPKMRPGTSEQSSKSAVRSQGKLRQAFSTALTTPDLKDLDLYCSQLSPLTFVYPAVLTLTPLDCPTDSQSRVLTLHADDPRLPVGRSSRNASKGLIAARNNAWFDSPTMSRQHATFYMTSESPNVSW